jgi:outer membrane protein assembly factor BamE (lipoprotein component of BamABCDE complex)
MLRSIALSALLAFVLAGCVSSGTNFNEDRVADIRKGVTTESELRQMFGEPGGTSLVSSGGRQLTWMYTEHKTSGQQFIPIAGPSLERGSSNHKMLMVTLDPEGKVADYHASTSGMESRGHTQDTPK